MSLTWSIFIRRSTTCHVSRISIFIINICPWIELWVSAIYRWILLTCIDWMLLNLLIRAFTTTSIMLMIMRFGINVLKWILRHLHHWSINLSWHIARLWSISWHFLFNDLGIVLLLPLFISCFLHFKGLVLLLVHIKWVLCFMIGYVFVEFII